MKEKEKIVLNKEDIKRLKKIQSFYKKNSGIEISFEILIHELTNKGLEFYQNRRKTPSFRAGI